MIRFESVSKFYSQHSLPALQDVSCEVEKGKTLAFIGESGCGKTTLLKMANRIVSPDKGRVTWNGDDLAAKEMISLRRRIGYVPQHLSLFPHLTLLDNVVLPLKLAGMAAEKCKERAHIALQQTGLLQTELYMRFPASLSGGQQQRGCLARALVIEPELLLLDEPFSALDAITRQILQREVKKLASEKNLTVLIVTHDLVEAMYLADTIGVMHHGRIEQLATPKTLIDNPATDYVRELTQLPALEVLRRE
jgi:osmoprotectant transport system ATP-binding protein